MINIRYHGTMLTLSIFIKTDTNKLYKQSILLFAWNKLANLLKVTWYEVIKWHYTTLTSKGVGIIITLPISKITTCLLEYPFYITLRRMQICNAGFFSNAKKHGFIWTCFSREIHSHFLWMEIQGECYNIKTNVLKQICNDLSVISINHI